MRCGHPWTVAEQPRMNVISSVLRMGHARFLSADLPTVISKNMYEMWTSVDRRRAAQDERHILRPKDGSCTTLSADLPTVISKNMYEMWTSVDRRRAAQDERHILQS
ncbi:hypothetical protein RRG08_062931 [Elysia crispata]|uniref:Uncharacterized protein n=1 Tax=Elysia crispata TaxID=231223 RepID=A0AAE0YSJ8_9GAST|nr:hypothetical protein RRG08_062931 [Elysia crispata]